ncbi:MAG: prepilin peptidase [Patescibacteria group bacterium]
MTILFTALLGAALGSFANVIIIRWHENASITGRSRCPACKKTLRPRHLVPILSWMLLRGKCAHCGVQIHFQYPIVEACAALLAVIAAIRHDPVIDTWSFVFESVVTIGLIVPVVMDIRWKELPVEYLVGIGIFSFVFHAILTFSSISGTIVAIAGASAFFGLQVLLSRGRWLGQGDVWFGGMMGAILGTPLLTGLAIYMSYLFGGIFAIVGLLMGAFRRKSRVPFAPALAAGTLVALWHGERILLWFRMAT